MSTDDGDILNFTNHFHEYLLEQKSKSTFSVFVFQLFGGNIKLIFFPNIIATFSLKKKKKKGEWEKEREGPSSAMFLRCSPFWVYRVGGELITFCGYSSWQL